MKIGVTSQNFRTITGHAGKTRRFLIFGPDSAEVIGEIERWDLPREMAIHAYRGSNPHPLEQLDILITAGCGQGFIRRLASMGVKVLATGETDPLRAALIVSQGKELPPPVAHDHNH